MKKYYLLLLLLTGHIYIQAQNIVINDDGSSADASAILDLQSESKGFVAPRMTTSQRNSISSPATGLVVYDTDIGAYYQYDGSSWKGYTQTSSGTASGDVPSDPSLGDKYYDETGGDLYIYTSDGWAAVVTGTAMETPYGDILDITFGSSTGNSITISSFETDASYAGYVILANSENSFTDLTNGDDQYESTTYASNGEQVIFDGTASESLTITLLMDQSQYYFKVVPYTGSRVYDNGEATQTASTSTCTTDSETESEICFSIEGDLRIISSNQVPTHSTGDFPNYEGPSGEEFIATPHTSEVDYTPSLSGSTTYLYNETGGATPSNPNFWRFGFATNGIGYNPMGLKPWENPNTGEENWEWQEALIDETDGNIDMYGAHVTSAGKYHYHGDIVGLADEDGTKHSAIYGWAADGYPIYYKYGYTDANDPTSAIKELISNYDLKSGSRTGTGTGGEDYPDGSFDGTYIQDYEWTDGDGDLDECNGRTGVTPEFPGGTYYYVITSDFPIIPNCFKGTPSDDFNIGS